MAYDIIEVVDPKEISNLTKLNKKIAESTESLIKFLKTQKEYKEGLDGLGKSEDDNTGKTEKKKKVIDEVVASRNKLFEINKKLESTEKGVNDQITRQAIKLQEATKAQKDRIKTENIAESSLTKMKQKLSELTKAYDDSNVRTRSAAKEISKLSKEIELAENETNRFQRGVGGYKNQIGEMISGVANGTMTFAQFGKGIAGVGKAMLTFLLSPAGLVIGVLAGLVLAGKALVKNSIEFGRAASSLSAITGATGKDLDFMKSKAKEYARESSLTATEVLTAFEKIGSAAPQLLKDKEALTEVTKAAIILSESTGGKLLLEDAAKATTAAMNQFNIPAAEAGRIINTLAAGSQAGSAEVQDLTASFKNVGAVASGAGMSLEQTVAALEVLGEKGLYAEEAGTKLRGSILRLQKAGIGYTSGVFNMKDALIEANQKMDSQATAVDKDKLAIKLFGAENIMAGKILLDNVDKYDQLTTAVTGTNTAYEMATVQTDNIANSNIRFGSAWQSLMLSIEDGNGIFSKLWKGFLDGMTSAMNGISKFIDKFKSKEALERKAAKTAEKEAKEMAKVNEEIEKEQVKVKEQSDKEKNASTKKAEEERKKIEEAKTEATIKAAEREYEMQLMLIKAAATSKEDAEEKTYQLKKEYLKKTLALMQIELNAAKGNELEKIKIQEKINDTTAKLDTIVIEERINENEKAGNKMLSSTDILNKRKEKQTAKYEEGLIATTQEAADIKERTAEEEVSSTASKEERKARIIEESVNSVIQIQDALFSFINSGYEKDLTELEQKNEKGIISDKEYAKQKAEIERKQAEANRLSALFNVAISTAQGIASALTQPPPLNVILAITAGTVGALQAAAILSEPLPEIPAFAKGGKATLGRGLAGEAGREIGVTTTGKKILFNEATYFQGEEFKGMHIMKNSDTEKYITQHSGFRGESRTDDRLLSAVNTLNKTIKDKPVLIFDKDTNKPIGLQQGGYREMRINKYRHV
jgi:TP901 family phage tail tape measure protein